MKIKTRFLMVMLGIALLPPVPGTCVWAETGIPSPSARRGIAGVNVRDFGATGDGIHSDTQSIQAAIDACSENQAGSVVLPAGKYLTGTLFLKNNVTLHLMAQATILGSKNLTDYADDVQAPPLLTEFNKCLIYAQDAQNIALTGRGTIDGQGKFFPQEATATSKLPERPMLMRFVRCRNLALSDLTFRSAASWCCNLVECDEVKINRITVRSRDNSNNDGFDIDNCHNVTISDCDISCQDDAFALQSHRPHRICRNIVITNCKG